MPGGAFGRPRDSGHEEMTREAAASGDPRKYTTVPMSKTEFARQMRMRERGKGTGQNKGYVSSSNRVDEVQEELDPKNPLNTTAPEEKAEAYRKRTKNSPCVLR